MSLFQTGFKVDASTPVASTSTTGNPAAGSAHKKRKRENNEATKIDDILNNTIHNAYGAAASSATQPSSSGPSKKHEEIDSLQLLGHGMDNKKQSSSSNTAEAVVNIEKLMKRLEKMEKAEHEKTTHVNGNKKPKIGNAATDALKGKGKDGNAVRLGKDRKAAAVDPSKAKKTQNKKKKKDDSAPKVDYIPDEAALAKREERKLKKEIYATTKKPSTAVKKGEDETQEQEADESAMHIDVLESTAAPSLPAKAPSEEAPADSVPTEEIAQATPQESKKKSKAKKVAATEKQPISEQVQAEPEVRSPVKEAKQVKQKPTTTKKEKVVENKEQRPSAPIPALVPAPAASGSDAGMTDLQKKMQKKLGGARFRWINEQLYTTSGMDALQLMEEDPAMFEDYHSGFASQATSWPSQPIQLFIDYFRKSYSSTTSPKPVIADLGCGKAELASTLVPLGYTVLSYDLVESEPYIIKAQCTKRLPLPGSSDINGDDAPGAVVDSVVCCLSLMGSDWLGMIQEARRVLKAGGKLKIAEVTSRFEDVKAFTHLITSLGFKLSKKDDSNTHFILFDFEKIPTSACKSPFLSLSSEAKVAKSQELLKPCIYKRR